MSENEKSPIKRISSALEGKFVPSVWWGRMIVALYWLKRKPVAMRTAPPPSARWRPPESLTPTKLRRADARRRERLGIQARRVRGSGGET